MIRSSQIVGLRKVSPDYAKTQQLKCRFTRLRRERHPFFLTGRDLEQIFKWKLRGQYGRQREIRRSNREAVVRTVTRAAFEVSSKDEEYELEARVRILASLPGVGVPVASAILALVAPNRYAVVDFRGWRQLFDVEKRTFTVADYKKYMRRIRPLALELGWPPQEVDLAIWEFDRRNHGGVRGGG